MRKIKVFFLNDGTNVSLPCVLALSPECFHGKFNIHSLQKTEEQGNEQKLSKYSPAHDTTWMIYALTVKLGENGLNTVRRKAPPTPILKNTRTNNEKKLRVLV